MKKRTMFIAVLALLSMVTWSCSHESDDEVQGFDRNGASNAEYSVSATKKVKFSRGNLQYQASENKWRFAEHQYDYIGKDNENISQSYEGWIDLFGWGTSGWNSGAVCYQPWSTSYEYSDYYPGGSYENSLVGSYDKADWGVYNRITNGGNRTGRWRTLTDEEWYYLISDNGKRTGKWALATIDGMYKGMIILSDDWTTPAGLTYTAGKTNKYETNAYTAVQWTQMEEAGAIFLPAAGRREGTKVTNDGSSGHYWSSTYYEYDASYVCFSASSGVDMRHYGRGDGQSVRLVQDAN